MKNIRRTVQLLILLLLIGLGIQFWAYTHQLTASRPNGHEAFLPIGGFTALKYWLLTGDIHPLHPAALVLFAAALLIAVTLKKSFCGWLCPVGFISEWLYKPWNRKFRGNVLPPRWLDLGLRSLKYLVLGFFVWAIGLSMDRFMLHAFLESDYWKMADVRMLQFFTAISSVSLTVVIVLVLLSIPIRNFWCRYLCPYGALLGLTGLLSPFKVRRDDSRCTHCRKCTRNCPAYLPVEASARISSPECTSCLTCVTGCPAEALRYSTRKTPWGTPRLSARGVAIGVLLLLFGSILLASWTGNWESQLPREEFQRLLPESNSLGHP